MVCGAWSCLSSVEEKESREWYIYYREGGKEMCVHEEERERRRRKRREEEEEEGGGGGGRGGAVPVSSLLEKWRVSAIWLVWQLLQGRL